MNSSSSFALRVWRDGTVRSLPVWILITLVTSNVLAALIIFRAAYYSDAEVPSYQLVLSLWLPISVYLLFGKMRTRCQRLDLALPIPARELWLSHSIAVVVAAAMILAAAFGVLVLNSLLLSRLSGGPGSGPAILPLLPPLAAALLLAISLVQGLQPSSWRLAGDSRYWALLITGLVAVPVCLITLSTHQWTASVLFLALATVLGVRAWARLPAAFELAPAIAPEAKGPAAATAQRPGLALSAEPIGTLAIARLVFNVLHNAPPWRQAMPWVLYFFVLLMGFFMSGAADVWFDADEIRSMNLPLGSYILFAGAGLLTYHLHRFDSLPLSRKTLFRILTLPTLVIFCFGWAAGRSVRATADPRPLVEYRIVKAYQWVEIDPAFMGFSLAADPPMLTAPWGESHRAWHRPLFRGASAILYSPFTAAEKSSARFEALMTSRAIERIYGKAIPYTEILERYFEVEGDELVGLKGDRLTLLADYPELEAPPEGPGTPLYLVLIIVPWLLLLALFTRSFRATSSVKLIRWVYWAGLLALLVLLIAQFVLAIAGVYSPAAAHGFLEIFVRWLGSRPLLSLATWVAGLGTIFLAYGLAQAQFLRAELPASPIQCALIDWGRKD
jgi:hypothetical protein